MYEILKDINSPDDVKKLNMEELKVLANDIRDGLFNRLTKIGGHFYKFTSPAVSLQPGRSVRWRRSGRR